MQAFVQKLKLSRTSRLRNIFMARFLSIIVLKNHETKFDDMKSMKSSKAKWARLYFLCDHLFHVDSYRRTGVELLCRKRKSWYFFRSIDRWFPNTVKIKRYVIISRTGRYEHSAPGLHKSMLSTRATTTSKSKPFWMLSRVSSCHKTRLSPAPLLKSFDHFVAVYEYV